MKYKRLFSIVWKCIAGLVIAGVAIYASVLIYLGPFSFNLFFPIDIPFPIHRDGAALSTDFRVKSLGLYELNLRFHFSGHKSRGKERDRILDLLGSRMYADGTYDEPGIPITIKYRITGVEKKTGKKIDRN